MFLSDVSIKRPVFATMMMVTLVVLGVVSYRRLAIDEYPDITYPVVTVQTSYPGASPEVVMREVSRPIEEALNTVQGLKEVSSTSLESSSIVRVQLNLGVNVMEALQDVQAKVARLRRGLPREIDDPVILRYDPNDRPIMTLAVQSDERTLRELTDLTDEVIATHFESVPGVGGVSLVGGTKRQIRVELDPDAMRAYQVSPTQVADALAAENQEVPAGRVHRGANESLVRVTGRVVDPKAFADIVVAVRNGVPVRLGDVGRVRDAAEEQRSAAFMNTSPAVALDIQKISGSNTVEVADAVRVAMVELQKSLPPDVKLSFIRDDSERIRQSLDSVQHELILGAVLTVLIIYLFLNSWRSTVITGLALPISIISAFFIMWVFGFTMNTMTLLALALAIGLLIDDAIVVRENIVRHLEMGKDHYAAAMEGTSEIGLAVVCTTLAVVAVFIPVAFMGGQIGMIFYQFGVTVAFAVLVSLFVSFTLDPMLSSVWPDPEVEHKHDGAAQAAPPKNPIRRGAKAFNDWFERVADRYPGWLDRALKHRALVMGVAVVSIVAAFLIVPTLGFTWMPDVDGGEFNVNFRAPAGSNLDYTVGKAQELASFLRKQPETQFTYVTVGGGFRGTPSNGGVYVRLVPRDRRKRSQDQIVTALRGQLRTIPGIRATITGTPTIFGGWRQPIQINVQGPEPTRLKIAADQVLTALRGVKGVAEPNSAQEDEVPQLDVRVDRQQAWAAGLGIGAIGNTLAPLFTGQRATKWESPQGYSYDVVVIYPDSMRASAADVANIPVATSRLDPRTGQPAMVPLGQVAEVVSSLGPQSIERLQLERQITLSAGALPGEPVGDVANRAREAIAAVSLPPGYRTRFGGDVQNLDETKGYVLEAMLLAVVFIYLILASLFGSFLQPLSIMLALPLSFIGVTLALLVTKGNLNVMTMIGIIMLMGLVTKNGILLIDFINQQRQAGHDRLHAILSSGRVRLRPIIMTTVAMIFGMIPLALALGPGSEQRAPMARAVIGGLLTSTLLTLFVVPVMYTLIDDFVLALKRRLAGGASPTRGAHGATPEPAAGD